MKYTEMNSGIISSWVDKGWEWGTEITHEEYLAALEGRFSIVLTPTRRVPDDWILPIRGKKVLGLASGGGQQLPILTALGAECTLLDISDSQIEKDRMVAEREGYSINLVKGDMTEAFPFEDESFDMIINPVSDCFIETLDVFFSESHRVLRKGGTFISGLSLDINYVFDDDEMRMIHPLPFNPLKDPELMEELMASDSGVQFSHSIEESLRGLLKAGFMIDDLYQDTNGEGRIHEMGLPSFLAVRCTK